MAEEMKIDIKEVMELHATGLKAGQIIEELGLEGVTPAKIGTLIKAEKAKAGEPKTEVAVKTDEPKTDEPKTEVAVKTTPAKLVSKGVQVMSAQEYEDYSVENGRTRFGGEKGKEIPCTIEELRAYINSKWKPSDIMEKYQMPVEKFEQLVMQLSVTEMRPKSQRIKYNLKADVFY